MKTWSRGLAAAVACSTLLGHAATADEPGPNVEFSFPDGYEALPLPVPADRVLTVAVERSGERFWGVILLTDGRLLPFEGSQRRPLAAPPVDVFAQGK